MSATHGTSLLAQARNVELVGINEVKFVPFVQPTSGRPVQIGVMGLSACSVVVVLSDHGAIVAHVGPNIPNAIAADSFIRLASSKMDEVVALYRQYRLYFAQSNATIIYAEFHGIQTSPEQTAIFRQRLRELNLPIATDCPYERPAVNRVSANSPAGTVLVSKDPGGPPRVFLEDRLITAGVGASSSGSSRSQASRLQVASSSRIVPGTGGSYGYNTTTSRTALQRADAPSSSSSSSGNSPDLPGTSAMVTLLTSTGPGFWAYSPDTGITYRFANGTIVPQAHWPPQRGRAYIVVIATREQRVYNFDTGVWDP
nr:hypothetical protein CFP56_53614 [Quercus suber]